MGLFLGFKEKFNKYSILLCALFSVLVRWNYISEELYANRIAHNIIMGSHDTLDYQNHPEIIDNLRGMVFLDSKHLLELEIKKSVLENNWDDYFLWIDQYLDKYKYSPVLAEWLTIQSTRSLSERRVDAAKILVKYSILLDAELYNAYVQQAAIDQEYENYDDAVENYVLAAEKDPENASRWLFNAGELCHIYLKSIECTKKKLSNAWVIEQHNPSLTPWQQGALHRYLGEIAENQGNIQLAKANYIQAIHLHEYYNKGDGVWASIRLVNITEDSSSKEILLLEALDIAKLENNVGHLTVVHQLLGDYYLNEGKFTMAETNFLAVNNLDEKYPWAYSSLGKLYNMKGNTKLAVQNYCRYLEIGPYDSALEDAVLQLGGGCK